MDMPNEVLGNPFGIGSSPSPHEGEGEESDVLTEGYLNRRKIGNISRRCPQRVALQGGFILTRNLELLEEYLIPDTSLKYLKVRNILKLTGNSKLGENHFW